MKCEYCNNNFKSKTNLTKHQNTAKYCLDLRGKSYTNKCVGCNEHFITKQQLSIHYNNCYKYQLHIKELHFVNELKKKDEQIVKLENIIRELQNDMKDIAISAVNKPTKTTTNNNNINMPILYLGEDKIKEKVELFDVGYFNDGQKGVARWAVQHLFTEDGQLLLKCTDPSRSSFMYRNEHGQMERDVNASKITKKIYNPIKDRTVTMYFDLNKPDTHPVVQKYRLEKLDEIKKMEDNNNIFKSELVAMTV